MRTLFVTGGAGYVGSHCCKAFAQAGWRVVVYDSLYRGWRDLARFGDLVEGDILDLPRLTAAMQAAKPDVVAHFAALTYVGESVEDPARYYENNSTGTWNILAAMREAGCGKIIFSSTAATYGEPQETPMPETHRQLPINPYGWSKLIVERMLHDYAAAYGMRYAALRYFNAAGADHAGDPPVLVASNAKAREVLGWTPTRSDIATIMRDAWAWHTGPRAEAPQS